MTYLDWSAIKRIAVIGDSISSRNNGIALHSWPELLGSMIISLGVDGITVRNYALPGLQWLSAHIPTANRLIGGALPALTAIKNDGCDLLIVCLGINDSSNANAVTHALGFQDDLPNVRVLWMRQRMGTADQQSSMNAVYTALGGDGFDVPIGALYDMGYTYDGLHPTNSGKQWIAGAAYLYLQQFMALTPITRTIPWLQSLSPEVRAAIARANT